MRDQIQVGLGVADSFLQRRLMMLCADKNKGNSFGVLVRHVLSDASQKFDAAEINKIHHLGFIDMTKYGRRIEDKLAQLQMEAKLVQIMFDTSSLQGNRNFARLTWEWKQGRGQIGQMNPKYQENADLSDKAPPRPPTLKLCTMNEQGHLSIPRDVRDKWLADPEGPQPPQGDQDRDLGETAGAEEVPAVQAMAPPPAMTQEKFKEAHPRTDAQAQEFLSKPANQDKAVEFRLASGEDRVVLEEQSRQGPADSAPMTAYELIVSMEKKGILDCKLTGHAFDRPAAVKRGEERDRIEVTHEAFSLFKSNAVTTKRAKSTNVTGLIGYQALSNSQYVQLVWRTLGSFE
eukprot:s717_g19.t1